MGAIQVGKGTDGASMPDPPDDVSEDGRRNLVQDDASSGANPSDREGRQGMAALGRCKGRKEIQNFGWWRRVTPVGRTWVPTIGADSF